MMDILFKDSQRGFTLMEVLISMAIGGLLMGAVVNTFVVQRKSYDIQEQVTEMVQTARAAMDMMTREIRMAGYDPAGAGFEGVSYNATQLRVNADLRGDNSSDPSDGDTNDSNEDIMYSYDSNDFQIDRNTGGGNQPFAENIDSFTFDYIDGNGNPTTISADIRQVRVTVTARTAKPDHEYSSGGGYRTYTLSSLITPPNLACP